MNRITIVNRTRYQVRNIHRIVAAVMADYWRTTTQPERVTITCSYRRIRDGFCGGYAYYHSGQIELKLSKDPEKVHVYRAETTKDDPAMNVARTLLHELCHCRGLKHGEMVGDQTYNVEYVRGFPLRPRKEPKGRPKTDETKIIRLRDRRKHWLSKKKRAETAIRRINKSLRYYERKAAACTIEGKGR